jgi:hypothetical protein
MATRNFSDTLKDDLETNVEFRGALLSEAMVCMVSGDVETGKVVLRECVNGTIGFLKLQAALGRSPKSLMRKLSPQGNPQARNLFEMVATFKRLEGPSCTFTLLIQRHNYLPLELGIGDLQAWRIEADWIGLAAGVTAKLKRGAMDGTANEARKAPVPRHMHDGVFSKADRAERISDTPLAVAMT